MSSSSSKKSSKPFSRNAGDWVCPDKSCGNLNFARRDRCNRCEKQKPQDDSSKKGSTSSIGHQAAKNSRGLFSADDWACAKCGNINWSRRQACNVCNAKKFADDERTGYGGGYNDRGVVEYKKRKSSESSDEYDEFGRRKKICKQDDDSSRRISRRDRSRSSRSSSSSSSSTSSSSSSSSSDSSRSRSRHGSRKSEVRKSRKSRSRSPLRNKSRRSRSNSRRHRSDSREKSYRRLEKSPKDYEKRTKQRSESPKEAILVEKEIKESHPPSYDSEEESGSDEDLSKYNLFDDDVDIEAIKMKH